MNERTQEHLHRWLPWTSVAGVLVSLAAFVFVEYYVVPRHRAERNIHQEARSHYLVAEETRASELRPALERIAALIDTLDGNPRTQEALGKAVAREGSIGEVWVANAKGLIVYYGRHEPPLRNVAQYPLHTVARLLDEVPEGLLEPMQRTAVLLPAVIGGYWYQVPPMPDPDMFPKHLVRSTEPLRLASRRPVEMMRVRDGLIAAASQSTLAPELGVKAKAPPDPSIQSMERSERLRLLGNLATLAILAGLIAFWISIPSWMLLDARQRGERAAAWGLFGLLGNLIALVVYLLVRRDDDSEAAGGA